jgi:hypothetical protein
MNVKKHTLHLLMAANAALALALAWLWVDPAGHLRGVRWRAPAAQTANYAAMVPALPGFAPADTSGFVAMLERPVFSPTRRPPEPTAKAKDQEPPADSLGTARLLGLFQGRGDGGVILQLGDKPRRLRLHDSADGWTLTAVQERGATFERAGQTRTLQLPRAKLTNAPVVPAAPPPAAAVPPRPVPPPAAKPAPRGGGQLRQPVFGGS